MNFFQTYAWAPGEFDPLQGAPWYEKVIVFLIGAIVTFLPYVILILAIVFIVKKLTMKKK